MSTSSRWRRFVGPVVVALIVAAVAAVLILPPRCAGERYGLIEDDGNDRRWGCFSTIK